MLTVLVNSKKNFCVIHRVFLCVLFSECFKKMGFANLTEANALTAVLEKEFELVPQMKNSLIRPFAALYFGDTVSCVNQFHVLTNLSLKLGLFIRKIIISKLVRLDKLLGSVCDECCR